MGLFVGRSNPIPTVAGCCDATGPTFGGCPMSKPSPLQLPLVSSTGSVSSSAAFRARTSARPTRPVLDLRDNGPGSSGGCSTASTNSGPGASSSRTLVDWLGGAWTSWFGNSATAVSRWRQPGCWRPMSELHTEGSGCSSWPTPTAGLWNDGEPLASWRARNERERMKGRNGNGMGMPLGVAVRMWPTPTCGDAKSSVSRNSETSGAHAGTSLCDATERVAGTGERLAPEWVEMLQGFPAGWTTSVGRPLVEPGL